MIRTLHRCAVSRRSGASGVVAFMIGGALTSAAVAGPEWVEQGDAGPLPVDAQRVTNTEDGTLTKISGNLLSALTGGDLEDMYIFNIEDPSAFSATSASLTPSARRRRA